MYSKHLGAKINLGGANAPPSLNAALYSVHAIVHVIHLWTYLCQIFLFYAHPIGSHLCVREQPHYRHFILSGEPVDQTTTENI